MNDRLVLSSSYFNISGGRREDSADTFRVLSALQSHSGEEAGLYAVSESSAPGPMGVRARRLVIEVVQGEYASRFDLSPGPRLRAAVTTAHERLKTEFGGHVRVGITVLVAEGTSLFLVQVPPAQAYVLHDGDLHSVTADTGADAVPFAHALGSADTPTTALFRDTIESDDTVVLLSSWFSQELAAEDLRRALGNGDPDAVTTSLLARSSQLSAREVTCVALQAVPYIQPVPTVGEPESEETPTVWDHVDETVASLSYVWSRAVDEFKPGQGKNAPRDGRPSSATTKPIVEVAGGVAAATALTDARPLAAGPISSQGDGGPASADISAPDHGTEELPVLDEQHPQPDIESDPRAAELDEVNTFIHTTMHQDSVSPPLEGFPDMNVAPERINPATAGQRATRTRRFGEALRPQSKVTSTKTPKPRRSGPGIGARLSSIPPAIYLWSAAAVVLVLGVWFFVNRSSGSSSTPPNYIAQAQAAADRALTASDMKAKVHDLAVARANLKKAVAQGATSKQIAAANAHIQTISDTVYHITRFSLATAGQKPTATMVSEVASFPKTGPQQIVSRSQLASGVTSLFILNKQQRWLYTIADPSTKTMTQTAEAGIETTNAPGVRWGPPTQLAAASLSSGDVALSLDSKFNLLFAYANQPAQNFLLATLTPPPAPTHAVASATYLDYYYLLDPKANQVWRYCCTDGDISAAPYGWITSPTQNQLKNAVSLTVDGDIWIGMRSGRVLRFAADAEIPFVKHTPVPFTHLTEVDTTPTMHRIYLFDAKHGQILELGKEKGAYVQTIILPKSLWLFMGQMTTSSDGHTIYFVSGSTVYTLKAPAVKPPKKVTPSPTPVPTATPPA